MQDYIFIGFSTPKKFHIFPWVIKSVEKTEFSHVYLKFYSKSADRYLIYQASGLAVNFEGETSFTSKNKCVIEFMIAVTPEEKTKILQTAIDMAGKPYGIKQVFGIGLVLLFKLFKKEIKNPWADNSKTYVCSELVALILDIIGFDFKNLDNVTPRNIYEKLRK